MYVSHARRKSMQQMNDEFTLFRYDWFKFYFRSVCFICKMLPEMHHLKSEKKLAENTVK